MRSRIDTWDDWARKMLLIPLVFVIYSGPATVVFLERVFDDEMYGESTLWEWALPVFVIWAFCVPFIVARANWNDHPDTCVFSLGAFVGLIALFTFVGVSVLKAATALILLPFGGVDSLPSDGLTYWIARVCTFVILVGIPMVALIVQVIQLRKETSHGL